jgi:cobalamin biosynthesis protein CobD/CbiB
MTAISAAIIAAAAGIILGHTIGIKSGVRIGARRKLTVESYNQAYTEKLLGLLSYVTLVVEALDKGEADSSRDLRHELEPDVTDLRPEAAHALHAASVSVILYMIGRLEGATGRERRALWASAAADIADDASRR